MSITLQKINDVVVKPMKTKFKVDSRPVRGAKLFSECFANILCLARKKSGKTCCVQRIIQESCGPNTSIIAFCSTLKKDNNWKAIEKWCRDNNIPFEGFPSIKDGKINILNRFLDRLGGEGDSEDISDSESEDESGQKFKKISMFGEEEEEEEEEEESDDEQPALDLFKQVPEQPWEKRMFSQRHQSSIKAKDPMQSADYLVVFDDLSNELKDVSFTSLVKKNRHYKIRTITSTQWIHDIRPDALKQMDYILLFKGFTDDKLEKIIRDGALGVDFERFDKLYRHAVAEPFCFLYVDTRHDGFRKNFNQLYKITETKKSIE